MGYAASGSTVNVGFRIRYVMMENGPVNDCPYISLYFDGKYVHADYNYCGYTSGVFTVSGTTITLRAGGTIIVMG